MVDSGTVPGLRWEYTVDTQSKEDLICLQACFWILGENPEETHTDSDPSPGSNQGTWSSVVKMLDL